MVNRRDLNKEKINLFQHNFFSFDDRYQRIIETIETEVMKRNQPKILDIGGGVGWMMFETKKRFPNADVYVLDNDIRQLNKAKSLYGKKIKLIHSDISNFIPKAKFDIILMAAVIEHLYKPYEALDKIYKFLKDDGVLILTTPNTSTWQTRLEFFLSGSSEYIIYPYINFQHIRLYSKKSMSKMLKETGFEILKIYGCGGLNIPVKWHRKNATYTTNDGITYKWTFWLKHLYKIKYNILSRFTFINDDMLFVSKKMNENP